MLAAPSQRTVRLLLAASAIALVGCPPGEEVSSQAFDVGATHKLVVTVEAGDEVHLWEDFDGGASRNAFRSCYRWRLVTREAGAHEERRLECNAFTGSRCSARRGGRYDNCQVTDCKLEAKRAGELSIEATLEVTGDCAEKSPNAVLRVRRVRP